MRKEGHVPYLVPGTDSLVQVPVAEIQVAEKDGYVAATPEQEEAYYREKSFAKENPVLRHVAGFGAGAASQVLGVPALVANVAPGVEGQSGGKWTAKILSTVTDKTPEEIEEGLRLIARHGAAGHFAGELFGMAAGTKGAGSLSKAGLATLGKGAAAKGAKLRAPAVATESALQHMALANEQAFERDMEATPESLMFAAALGGIGPLAFASVSRKGLQVARKGAEKLDKARADKFRAAIGEASPGTPAPARFVDVFHADPAVRLKAAAGFADEAAEAAGAGSRFFKEAGRQAERAARRAPAGKKRAYRWAGWDEKGAILGGVIGDNLMGAIAGGAVGAAVQHFGPAAAGWALKQVSAGFREAAKHALQRSAEKTRSAAVKDLFAPLFAQGGRSLYRSRVKSLVEDSTSEVDRLALSEGQELVDSIGNTFGDLNVLSPDVVHGAMGQYLGAIHYLKSVAPSQPLLVPGMPQLGKREIPLGQMESYLRRVYAVMNPTAILEEMENGNLHRETVEAMDAVYPSMMMDLRAAASEELSTRDRVPSRGQAMMLDKLFGAGVVYGAQNPGFQARLGMAAEAQALIPENTQGKSQGAKFSKPGRREPTMAQQYRTGSQRASESIGN